MSCPTCGHTMHGIGAVPAVGGQPVFWCPRCGTVEDHADGITDVGVPKLVERCRAFAAETRADLLEGWQRLGVAESIHLPADRRREGTGDA